MSEPAPLDLDQRLLILPPSEKDRLTTERVLDEAKIARLFCASLDELIDELRRGAAAVILPEEALEEGFLRIQETLREQDAWSDLPVLLLARPGANSLVAEQAAHVLGNVVLLERPVRISTLVSTVRTALRARQRQYQIRAHLEERLRAVEALRDADRRKNEFLATLGHELRNPLSPLLTSLELLKLIQPENPAIGSSLAVMQRQIDHLVRLVNDLLEVSRITRGVIEIRREVVDLQEILDGALENVRAALDAAGHQIAVEIHGAPLWVYGDAVRLTQVFSNLLNNAVKYTDQYGRIVLRARREGNEIAIEVSDDGIGIAAENLRSIFDMFAQVDRSDRRTQGGLGIGLTLASSLVAQHGGSISARSAGLGRGSSFEVRLPTVAVREPLSKERPSVARVAALAGRDVLVVDDNRDAAQALAILLAAAGARVRTAYGGAESLQLFAQARPDVVLLDLGMPLMDGYEVARRMRAAPGGGAVQLVALSGWGQAEDVERAARAGFDRHLVKPVDAEHLREAIARRPVVAANR